MPDPIRVHVKSGVVFSGFTLASIRILAALAAVAGRVTFPVTVTCGCESHAPTDPHTLCKAVDVRTVGLTQPQKSELQMRLMGELGKAFTVLYEPNVIVEGVVKRAEHLHIQPVRGTVYDPTEP